MHAAQYDLAIVGCGPAGLSAAINAKIRKLDFVLFGTEFCSLKLHQSPIVDNYLGFPHINGEELRQQFLRHVETMGIEITRNKITNIFPADQGYTLLGKDGTAYLASSVILATGVAYSQMLPGEGEFVGRGVSYCGTCDGPLYRGKNVAVIGYTQEAESEVEYLARVANHVHYFVRYRRQPQPLPANVTLSHIPVLRLEGNGYLEAVVTKEGLQPVDGVFIFRDAEPPGQLLLGVQVQDQAVVVDRNLQTNLPGVFAAGDITGRPWQLAKAIGEGNAAALQAAEYLRSLKQRQNDLVSQAV